MDAKVEERMTRNVAFCYPDDTLIKVIQVFEKKGMEDCQLLKGKAVRLWGLSPKVMLFYAFLKKLEELYEKVEENHQDERGTLFSDIPSDFNFKMEKEVKKT